MRKDTDWILKYYGDDDGDHVNGVVMYWNPYKHCWPMACNECYAVYDWGNFNA
jgi:hypothetical protein